MTGTQVAMVGLGRMGRPMARRMGETGFDVVGVDASPEAGERAQTEGIAVANPAALAADPPAVVCSSLPDTAAVEAAVAEIAPDLRPGTVWCDLSTIGIEASRALAAQLAEREIVFLDSPVSGTSIHAEAGTLVAMIGGPESAIETVRPMLSCFASRVERVGDNGAGLELKLITNRLLTTHLAAIAEAILSVELLDLDINQVLDLLRAGAVPRLLDYKAKPLAERNYEPQFTVDLMAKDLRLAAADLAEPPLAAAARRLVETTSKSGHGDDDLVAVIETIEAQFHQA